MTHITGIKLVPRISFGSLVKSTFSTATTDEGFKVWINLFAESSFPARKNSRNSFNWFASAAIFAENEKHAVLKGACDASFGRSRWNNMVRRKRSIDVSKYIQFYPIFL